MDMGSLLTEEQRQRLARTSREVARIYALPDRWLAEELLRLARRVRAEECVGLGDPLKPVYENGFLWHLVPEIAARLGATRFEANERTLQTYTTASDEKLREYVSATLPNVRLLTSLKPEFHRTGNVLASAVLDADPANGNPVAIAIERVWPARELGMPAQEWLARHIQTISRSRGHAATWAWHPELQQKPAVEAAQSPEFGLTSDGA